MTGQPQTVEKQLALEERARRIVLAAVNNKTLMAQVRASYKEAAAGVKPERIQV